MLIARQPIFNRQKNVVAYEVLFPHQDARNPHDGKNPQEESSLAVGRLFEDGLPPIVGEKTAYINAGYDFLMSETLELLDPENLMVGITEDVLPDEDLIRRINGLRKKGYRFALDDYEEEMTHSLLGHVRVVKYDLRKTPMDKINLEKIRSSNRDALALAENIDTTEEFMKAKEMGFEYFQGLFFRKPEVMESTEKKNQINKNSLRIFRELQKDEPSFTRLEEMISMDSKMTYTLIRISSKAYNQKKEFTLMRALTNMGLRQLQRWIYILMLQSASKGKPDELMSLALVRLGFGEEIARNSVLRQRREEIALMCLLSVIDAMLDEPMEQALSEIQISRDIKDALISRTGDLAVVMKLIDGYESGEWTEVEEISKRLKISSDVVSRIYIETVRWADEVMKEL